MQDPTLFDPVYYLSAYPDVAQAGMDAAEHFDTYGWREGRDPSAVFSVGGYMARNPDVAAEGMNPLTHFRLYGRGEAREGWNPDAASSRLDERVRRIDTALDIVEARLTGTGATTPASSFPAGALHLSGGWGDLHYDCVPFEMTAATRGYLVVRAAVKAPVELRLCLISGAEQATRGEATVWKSYLAGETRFFFGLESLTGTFDGHSIHTVLFGGQSETPASIGFSLVLFDGPRLVFSVR